MKHFALLLLLVPTLATADLFRCVIDGKVSYQESGCVGKKMDMDSNVNILDPVPAHLYRPVPDAPPPVVGGYTVLGAPQTEPTQYIRTYSGPRYYHDHGPPTYGGTGRFSPYYDYRERAYNPRAGYYDPQPAKSGDGYRKR